MHLNDAIADYLRYAKIERNLTPKTMEPYQSWLRHYHNWLQANGYAQPTLQDFNALTLRQFYYYCREERNHRPRTVRGAFAPLRALGEFLVLHKAIVTNPTLEITLPKKDAAERIVVTDAQVMQMWNACERIYPPKRAALIQGVLSCFVYAGLRSFECLALRMHDTDITQEGGNCLLIRHGKGEKSRRVFLPEPGVAAIRAWIAARGQTEQEWLWAYSANRHLGENGLCAMMEELRTVAGLREESFIGAHSIRHNFATRLLRGGANIRDVQTALGHSQLTTTAMYLHADEERLRSIAHLSALPLKSAHGDMGSTAIQPPQAQDGTVKQRRVRVLAGHGERGKFRLR
jgi:site-specific recombinase XerD